MLRFDVSHRGRLNTTTPIAKHVAYIMRDDEYGPAQAHLRYMTRDSERTRSREDLMHKEAHNLPDWANDNPAVFFAAAEQHERANGRFCTTWMITMPRELTTEQNITAVQHFLHGQFGTKQVYAWAMHDTAASDGGRNPHIHVMFSSRTLDGIARSPQQFFSRYNPEHPEMGGARKDDYWTERRAIGITRQAWSDMANWHLEGNGASIRLDPRSLKDQGIDRTAGKHLGPAHSVPAKYKGYETKAWQEMRHDHDVYVHSKPAEQAKAAAYWEARKHALGMQTGQTPIDAFIECVSQRPERPPASPKLTLGALQAQEQQLTQIVEKRETHLARIRKKVEKDMARPATWQSPGITRKIDTVVEAGDEARLAKPLIGNQTSKIYHEPGQPNYGDVHPKNQTLFWSHADAKAAGFRMAANSHHGVGATEPWDKEARDRESAWEKEARESGSLVGRFRVGLKHFGLIDTGQGAQAILPWRAALQLMADAGRSADIHTGGALFRAHDTDRGMGW